MTVCHPVPRIAHIYEDIDILVFWYEDCILPDEIRIRCTILIEHEESLSMHMEWMLHRMHGIFIIGESDFYETPFFKIPIDVHPFFFCLLVSEYPLYGFVGAIRVHHRHSVFPLDAIRTLGSSHIVTHTTHISHSLHLHSHGETFVWCLRLICRKRLSEIPEDIVGF